tara:strand:+ start:15511 stop:16665 length:1155 start_codon:yes stop_codon:yes gene_type:complete
MSYSLTFRDAIDHLKSWANVQSASEISIRTAVASAYREVTQYRSWDYLNEHHRIPLVANYSTGTITYDHTGGSNEREVTLTGVAPTWAATGSIRAGNVTSRIATRESSTVLTLDETLNFTKDVAALTTFSIFKYAYTLPADFQSCDVQYLEDAWQMRHVEPREFLYRLRNDDSTGKPYIWAITGDPRNRFRKILMVYPTVDTAETLDFYYHRRPRELRYSGHENRETVGTVTTSGATVTGVSTLMATGMSGSIIRFGDTAGQVPGPLHGPYPYDQEQVLKTFTSTTSFTIESALTTDISTGVKYVISDPIDIDPAMTEAFLRCCEYQMGVNRKVKNVSQLKALYDMALSDAAGAANSSKVPRFSGDGGAYGRRIADLPYSSSEG